jgi:hypothetical protein
MTSARMPRSRLRAACLLGAAVVCVGREGVPVSFVVGMSGGGVPCAQSYAMPREDCAAAARSVTGAINVYPYYL